MEKQILIIYAGTNGYLDDLPVKELGRFEEEMYKYLELNHKEDVLKAIVEKGSLDDDLRGKIKAALDAFKEQFAATMQG